MRHKAIKKWTQQTGAKASGTGTGIFGWKTDLSLLGSIPVLQDQDKAAPGLVKLFAQDEQLGARQVGLHQGQLALDTARLGNGQRLFRQAQRSPQV